MLMSLRSVNDSIIEYYSSSLIRLATRYILSVMSVGPSIYVLQSDKLLPESSSVREVSR